MMQQPTGAAQTRNRPGQMTAVMRALPQATGPKVLRVGLVQSGRVIEERVIKQRTTITVGSSEKCMLVVADGGVGPSFPLFELIGGEYHLNFTDHMTGRVALPSGISDLDTLRGQAKRIQQGVYQIRLTDDSRGKVALGDITLLFQFVAPPPVQPKPQLPVSVESGLSAQIDWRFTIIAAFSFLLHFGGVGMLYSDWMDPVVDEQVSIQGLLDSVKSLPPPPQLPELPTDTGKSDGAGADKDNDKSAGAKTAGQGAPSKTEKGALSSGERAALSKEMDQLEMATLGALTGGGPATAGVLGRGSDVPTGSLEQAAMSGSGVGAFGGSGLNLGNSGGGGKLLPGGGGGSDLANIGDRGGTTAAATAGTTTAVKGPVGNANASVSVQGGDVGNANRVVAGMRAGFRNCYNHGLAANPDMSGSVRVTARIGPGGEVQSVSAAPSGTISGDVASCIAARVRSAQFDPPAGGAGATLVIPVTLVQQK